LLETERNQRIQRYLSELSPYPETNYFLWKVTKRLKRQQTQFSPIRKQDKRWPEVTKRRPRHLSRISPRSLSPRKICINEEKKLLMDTNTPVKRIASTKPLTVKEMQSAIRVLNLRKAPDLIIKICRSCQKKEYD